MLGNFLCRAAKLILIREGQGPAELAAGMGGCGYDIISLTYHFFCLSPSLWDSAIQTKILPERTGKPKLTKK